MENNRIKICVLVVLLAVVSVSVWVAANRISHETPPVEVSPWPTRDIMPTSATKLTRAWLWEIFAGNASCSWPCWQGITPGVTTSDDALQLLQTSPVVSKFTIQSKEYSSGIGTASWFWEVGNDHYTGTMDWRDGIVLEIMLDADPYPKFTIRELIDKFGPPEKNFVEDCTFIPDAPTQWCASLFFAKKGFQVELEWDGSENADYVEFSPYDPVGSVYLFEPSTVEDRLLYWRLGYFQITDLRDWKGYGNLLELYYY
jgi:hypothetical protein